MAQSYRASRRRLLYGLGLGGLGFATSSWAATLARVASPVSPLANLVPRVVTPLRLAGIQDWTAAIGATFLVQGEAGPVAVTLVAVKSFSAVGTRPAGLRPSAFAVTFEGNAGGLFPAGDRTYVFQQTGGSQLQLFVGGKTVAGTRAQLTAVLN